MFHETVKLVHILALQTWQTPSTFQSIMNTKNGQNFTAQITNYILNYIIDRKQLYLRAICSFRKTVSVYLCKHNWSFLWPLKWFHEFTFCLWKFCTNKLNSRNFDESSEISFHQALKLTDHPLCEKKYRSASVMRNEIQFCFRCTYAS